jgi:hypothetical protein
MLELAESDGVQKTLHRMHISRTVSGSRTDKSPSGHLHERTIKATGHLELAIVTLL